MHLIISTIFVMSFTNFANGQDPKGDRLLSYGAIARFQTIVCLASTTVDMRLNGTVVRKAGQVFRSQCTNEPEEIWIVKSENGIKTMRPKHNESYCLTLDANNKPPRVAPCDPKEAGQAIEDKPWNPGSLKSTLGFHLVESSCLEITGMKTKRNLIYDAKENTVTKYSSAHSVYWFTSGWMWVSGVEKRAKGVRDLNFVFPIEGNNTISVENTTLGKQYFLGYTEQMMHSTKPYPKVTLSKGSCKCQGAASSCNCFPIDYGLSPSNIIISEVNLDLSLKPGGPSELSKTVNRVPTGMYAIPGTTMEIRVPEFDKSNITIVAELYTNSDSLDKTKWKRPPGITVKETLLPGLNKIRSPYGGPLFLEVFGRDTNAKPIVVTISGIPMANFILGKTNESEWANQLKRKPSWITYQGEHVGVLDLKAPFETATHSQMVSMMKRLDLVMKNEFLLSGYDLNPKNIEDVHAVPQGWMWWTREIALTARYGALSGNPVRQSVYHDGEIALNFTKWDPWMWGHELGHNMQTPCYSIQYGPDITNNIYAFFMMVYFCGNGKYPVECGASGKKDFMKVWNDTVAPALASGKVNFLDNWCGLTMWMQMIKNYGYWVFRELNRIMREIKVDPTKTKYINFCNKSNEQLQYDGPYELLSDIVKEDLTSHFNTYNVSISAEAKKRVAAKKYPQPKVNISGLIIKGGDSINWKLSGQQPDYALKPYKEM